MRRRPEELVVEICSSLSDYPVEYCSVYMRPDYPHNHCNKKNVLRIEYNIETESIPDAIACRICGTAVTVTRRYSAIAIRIG